MTQVAETVGAKQPVARPKTAALIEQKLYLDRYKVDEVSHLWIIDRETCLKCRDKPCIITCPANVYDWEEEKITVAYDNCVECGACRIVCPYQNIGWRYPRWGLGIAHRYG